MEWAIYKCNHKKPESIEAYNLLSKKNKECIEKWLIEKSILSKGVKRAGNRRRAIIKLLTFVKKDYDKINYDDYVKVASAISKAGAGVHQKNEDRYFVTRFLKDIFEDYEKKFKGLKLLRMEQQTEDKKINAKDLLTELEIDKMMRVTSDMKKISLVGLISVTAGRPEEILKLRWIDCDFNKNLIYLFSAKTGKKRAIPIDSVINHLKRLKQETGAKEDDLIFPSVSGKIMTIAGLNFMLQELGRKAGIKKKIRAYLFRHTRLSFLITKLSPKVYEDVAGHSLEMGMKTYAHLSQDAVIKEMREKVFNIQELSPEEKNELRLELEKMQIKYDSEITETNGQVKYLLENLNGIIEMFGDKKELTKKQGKKTITIYKAGFEESERGFNELLKDKEK